MHTLGHFPTDGNMSIVSAYLDSGTRVTISTERHSWFGDEPLADGGSDEGPTPYEMLLGSLAACTAITATLASGSTAAALPSEACTASLAPLVDWDEQTALKLAERVDSHDAALRHPLLSVAARFSSEIRAALVPFAVGCCCNVPRWCYKLRALGERVCTPDLRQRYFSWLAANPPL